MVASACPRFTRCPVSDTSRVSIQPEKRGEMLASPRSSACTPPAVRKPPPIAWRVAVAVRMPIFWTRSWGMSTGTSPGGAAGPGDAGDFAAAAGPVGLGTRVMPQIGQSPGWSCWIWGCMGQ